MPFGVSYPWRGAHPSHSSCTAAAGSALWGSDHFPSPPTNPPAAFRAPKSDQRRFRCGPVQRSSGGVRCPTAAGRHRGGGGGIGAAPGGGSEWPWGVGAAYKNPSTGGGREQRGRSRLHPLPPRTDPRPWGWAAALHPPFPPLSPPLPVPTFPFYFPGRGTFPFGSLDLGGGPKSPFLLKVRGYRSGPAVEDLGYNERRLLIEGGEDGDGPR